MTELELYKFITDNSCEFHWFKNDEVNVRLFVGLHDIAEFNAMLGDNIMDEDGIECTMRSGYFCFEMDDICEYFGIELEKVFKND